MRFILLQLLVLLSPWRSLELPISLPFYIPKEAARGQIIAGGSVKDHDLVPICTLLPPAVTDL